MRFPIVLCFCFCVANSSALAQQTDPSRSLAPAPQPATPQAIQQTAPQQTAPQSDPEASFDFNDLEPAELDDLDLDSSQSFDFDDSADSQFASSSDYQSSIASNSNFRGASPQMIGDFGGGSTMLTIGQLRGINTDNQPPTLFGGNQLTVPLPLAGGSRRIKIAENNQVTPLNRVYGTFNYFRNSSQAIGTGLTTDNAATVVDSESQVQYTVGFEKTFFYDLFSVDVRMPFTGGFDQTASIGTPIGPGSPPPYSDFALESGGMGNLSTTIKALLLQTEQTSISGGLSISLPTGSGVSGSFTELTTDVFDTEFFTFRYLDIDNDAVHLMPFLGAYRPFGESWWLQAFTQIDTPTNGNDVRVNGQFIGRLTEQTLLYADISLGKWWYRSRCNQCDGCDGRTGRHRRASGVTGVASILELHYTTSLNDADGLFENVLLGPGSPGTENRFDVLNLTAGLQVEISERWRINVAGAFPLRDGRFENGVGRREDRLFDSEFTLQVNRFF